MNTPKKVVVLLSGGLDSVLSLAELVAKPVEEVERVYALIFSYGQSSIREVDWARRLCENWRVPYRVQLIELMGSADTHREIPGRNLIFVAHAAALAAELHFDTIAIGAEPDSTYTDSSIDFLQRADKLLASFGLSLIAPVKHYANKKQLVIRALDLGVPLHYCHSSRSNAVDGACKTSALFLDSLASVFLGLLPGAILTHLSRLNTQARAFNYQVNYGGGLSFKYAAALLTIASKTREEWEAVKPVKVFSTGSWMNDLRAVSTTAKLSGCFKFVKSTDMHNLTRQPVNCNSQPAQWGLKQAMSELPRARYMKAVACRVVQGHFARALIDLGYRIELPAYRMHPYIEGAAQ